MAKGRDKKRDDEMFNCSQEHEIKYVADQYGDMSIEISIFLKECCSHGTIKNFTHADVYKLIKDTYDLDND